jgi:hypothetical protein
MGRLTSLADGQLPTTVAAIYTVPTGNKVKITSLHVYNTNVTAQDVNIYVTRSGGTRRQLYRSAALAQFATFNMLASGESITLDEGDTIDGDTTTASAADYLITGEIE